MFVVFGRVGMGMKVTGQFRMWMSGLVLMVEGKRILLRIERSCVLEMCAT